MQKAIIFGAPTKVDMFKPQGIVGIIAYSKYSGLTTGQIYRDLLARTFMNMFVHGWPKEEHATTSYRDWHGPQRVFGGSP